MKPPSPSGRLRTAAGAAVAIVLVAACVPGDDPAVRRRALEGIVAAADVRPPSGDVVEIDQTRSKGTDAVYTATGTLTGSRADAVDRLEETLRDEGWDVVESAPVDAFLGWRILATRDRMVADVWVGDVEPAPGLTPAFAPLEGAVHTQLSVGRRDSNWEWTQFDD